MEKCEFPLFIGSRKRINFPMSKLVAGAVLFVEPAEFKMYFAMYGGAYELVQLGKNDGGFAYLLNTMQEYAMMKGIKRYMFCDDDVLGYKRRDGKKCSINEIWMAANEQMDVHGYSQVMISFAGHNWFFKGNKKENIGAWCMLVNDTDAVRLAGGHDEKLRIFNDWDISAKLILAGRKNACIYDYQFNHKMKSQKGGAEEIYRNNRNMEEAAGILAAKYGKEAIRTVTAHEQTEVRFNWGWLAKQAENRVNVEV